MHLIINLNLAIDRIIEISRLQPGGVHRAITSATRAGGKGVNVARVLKALGEPSTVLGFLGGSSGEMIRNAMIAEEIEHEVVNIQEESRTCMILRDLETGDETVVNERGPTIGTASLGSLSQKYESYIQLAETVIISGSLPPGLPEDTYAHLLGIASRAGRRTFLDTSGPPLIQALEAEPFTVKINHAEASDALSMEINTMEAAVEAASRLCSAGARNAMVTLGRAGAAAQFEHKRFLIRPPALDSARAVGSGDAVFAGLASALRKGQTFEQALRFAIASGTATAKYGISDVTSDRVSEIAATVVLTEA
jgi:tagatose 6-phosphate kinase